MTLLRLEALLDRLENLLDDHESRIRALEKARWKLAGALGLAVLAGGAIIQVCLNFR